MRRPAAYRTYTATSLSELTDAVSDARDGWDSYVTIFRGQRQDLPLVPKVGRLGFASKEDVQRRLRAAGVRWRVGASAFGREWAEARMFEEFRRMVPAYEGNVTDDEWELLAVAQHHGLPTRLLDWTYNHFVAAWFAVGLPPFGDAPGVVWVHVPDESDFIGPRDRAKSPLALRRADRQRPLVFEPRFVSPRIRAQSGLFTLQLPTGRSHVFAPVDAKGSHLECMAKIFIPAQAFLPMRNELDAVGVNAAGLFPDLDGLCRSLQDAFAEW